MDTIINKALELLQKNKGIKFILINIDHRLSMGDDDAALTLNLKLIPENECITVDITNRDLCKVCCLDQYIIKGNSAMTEKDFYDLPLSARQSLRVAFILWNIYKGIKDPSSISDILKGRDVCITKTPGYPSISIDYSPSIDKTVVSSIPYSSISSISTDDYDTSSTITTYISSGPYYYDTTIEETIDKMVEEKLQERLKEIEANIENIKETHFLKIYKNKSAE